jgi:hypothetical protein
VVALTLLPSLAGATTVSRTLMVGATVNEHFVADIQAAGSGENLVVRAVAGTTVRVTINGTSAGQLVATSVAPMTMSLPDGAHEIELASDNQDILLTL